MGEFWIYENRAHKQARVHKGDCRGCNHGNGIHPGSSNHNGKWHGPYPDRSEAFKKAKALRQDNTRGCNVCSP
jgi:hypothetical protein